jgi:hypothetical protein
VGIGALASHTAQFPLQNYGHHRSPEPQVLLGGLEDQLVCGKVHTVPHMGDYNLQLVHKPGVTNKVDLLSRCPNYNQGKEDNGEVLVLPPHLFVNVIEEQETLEELVLGAQEGQEGTLQCLQGEVGIQSKGNGWFKDNVLVILDEGLFQRILKAYHDHPSAGHPGILKMYQIVKEVYWWLHQRDFIMKYVQGCATCQSTKSGTTCPRIPIMPITPKEQVPPFVTIALDLITDLPLSQGYDSILTITNHDCSKAVVFLPCSKTVMGEGIAQLYVQHVFPHFGVPRKVILDQDPWFTGKFMQELCKQLHIKQNISSAYHPQMDGQSERTNQWLEQYLCIQYMEIFNKTIGHHCYPSPNLYIMLGPVR